MGDEASERAAVTPLIWIGYETARGVHWYRCGKQFIRDYPSREWIVTRTPCFNSACEGNPAAEHQWRYFMLYVANLRVLGEL